MPRQRPGPLRILIADTNYDTGNAMRSLLSSKGYVVVATCTNGRNTVDSARRLNPDVIVIDETISGTGCLDVATTLVKERIAVVVLVAESSQPEFVRLAAQAGIYSCFVRPLRPESLISGLEIAHSQWQAYRDQELKVRRLSDKEQTRTTVDLAKRVLMTNYGYTETAAYRIIQSRSMTTRRSMRDVSESIISSSLRTDKVQSGRTGSDIYGPAVCQEQVA